MRMSLLDQLEPHARVYMQRILQTGGKPLPQLSLEAARQYMRDSQTAPIDHPSVNVRIVDNDGIRLTIFRPASLADQVLPAVLYLHGGGWVLGGVDTHARIVRELALRARAAVIVPEYSLSPEVHFPIALEQCYAAALWTIKEGPAHAIDPTRLAVAGDSAGGNLAAAVALRAAKREDVALKLQVLLCPALQAGSSPPSYEEFGQGLNLTREGMEWFWSQYVPDPQRHSDPEVSPLQANDADLRKLCPALIITAECDVLRDEGEKYAHRLAELGIEVTAMRALGTLHNFYVIDALQESGPARSVLYLVGEALRKALQPTGIDERQ
jgi:acetyl esterase/lipase